MEIKIEKCGVCNKTITKDEHDFTERWDGKIKCSNCIAKEELEERKRCEIKTIVQDFISWRL